MGGDKADGLRHDLLETHARAASVGFPVSKTIAKRTGECARKLLRILCLSAGRDTEGRHLWVRSMKALWSRRKLRMSPRPVAVGRTDALSACKTCV